MKYRHLVLISLSALSLLAGCGGTVLPSSSSSASTTSTASSASSVSSDNSSASETAITSINSSASASVSSSNSTSQAVSSSVSSVSPSSTLSASVSTASSSGSSLPTAQYPSSFTETQKAYYKSAIGLRGSALKNALYAILRGSYNGGISYTACNTALPVIDRDPKNSANVIEIYTGNSVKASDRLSGNVGIWNKEHVYPQSRGSFNTSKNGVGTDCHSLHASDSKVNGARENFNFYQFASDDTNYTKIYTNEGYDSKTKLNSSQGKGFEPVDFVKGECARSVFYMAVMWPEYCSITNTVLQDAPYELGMLKYIIDWNQNDPVDEREKYRNQAVYKYQNNYNPFIDAPEWVNLIWDANGLLI